MCTFLKNLGLGRIVAIPQIELLRNQLPLVNNQATACDTVDVIDRF